MTKHSMIDLAIVGGGINGCGIARDAAGRGLTTVLFEQSDLAQATSSASTKLFHGGLRYLEYYEFRLVREALIEREVLLRAMPHISWPMRFVLPHHQGLRPAWLLRLGLFIYDHLGGRKILPATRSLDFAHDVTGGPLKESYVRGFEYSDCWVEDSRLVVLNARDAANRGANILTRTRLESAAREDDHWILGIVDRDSGQTRTLRAKALVNAGGPWVEDIILHRVRQNTSDKIRLVRGSHVVTNKLYDHDRAYIFQQSDGRIIFTIPYETDFTLIGTTDVDHEGDPKDARCSDDEKDYLCRAASEYFKQPVAADDVVWTYSGVRPLYDDGASSSTEATRDYVLKIEDQAGSAPLLNIFGGKITTYRRLAESALEKLKPYFSAMGSDWTATEPLPGGDFPHDGVGQLIATLQARYPFIDDRFATRLIKAYGTLAEPMLEGVRSFEDLGRHFGWNLTEREVSWLMDHEWAQTADDVVWRRSKIGLRLSNDEIGALDAWMAHEHAARGQALKLDREPAE